MRIRFLNPILIKKACEDPKVVQVAISLATKVHEEGDGAYDAEHAIFRCNCCEYE